ncbi:MAG: family 16 glycoside hydrolase [Pirellulales bacterium]
MVHHSFFTKRCYYALRQAVLITPFITFLVSPSTTPLFAETDKNALASESNRWHSLLDERAAELADQTPIRQTPIRGKQPLGKWELADQEEFAEHGKVYVDQGILTLEQGYPATGVRLQGPFPKSNYEIQLEAKRTDGGDFFCGLTFPVGEGSLTLILGGWGGWAVGMSCIDGDYAIDNETLTVVQFQQDRWYSVRMCVTDQLIEVWIDKKRVIQLETEGKELLISDRMDPCLPLGLATWHTTGAIRNIRYRILEKKSLRSKASAQRRGDDMYQ